MLSELAFGSFLVYGPRARTARGKQAWTFVHRDLKQDRYLPAVGETTSRYVARRLRQTLEAGDHTLETLFSPTPSGLVPVPRSSPHKPGALWPAERLARALVAEGLAPDVFYLLERRIPVPRSSRAYTAQDRPSPEQHHESLNAPQTVTEPLSIVLVDDVVTRGSTLIACASKLMDEAFFSEPSRPIRAFAAVRTLSDAEDVPDMRDPCVGTIHYRHGRLRRHP